MAKTAKSVTTAKSTPKSKFSTVLQARKQALVTFGATLLGFAAGIPVTLAFLLSASSPLTTRVVSMTPASADLTCSQPAVSSAASTSAAGGYGGGAGGQVLGDSTTITPPAGGQGGGNQTPPPFVQHMLGGDLTANGSITGPTGPGSTNTVSSHQTEIVTVVNDNDLSVSNSNTQSASTGNANVSGNTNGGSATTGDAWNNNSANFNFNVNN